MGWCRLPNSHIQKTLEWPLCKVPTRRHVLFIQCKRTHSLLWIFWNSLQFRLIQRKGTHWKDWEWDREKELRRVLQWYEPNYPNITMIWAKLLWASQHHDDIDTNLLILNAMKRRRKLTERHNFQCSLCAFFWPLYWLIFICSLLFTSQLCVKAAQANRKSLKCR